MATPPTSTGPVSTGPISTNPNAATLAPAAAGHPSNVLLDVFPTGLLIGGVASATRAYLWSSTRVDDSLSQAGLENRVLAMAERWPELLAEALVAAVVSALVLGFAARSPRSRTTTGVALGVTFLALGAFVTGYPSARPGLHLAPIGAALGITLLAFGLTRIPFRGVVALAVGALLGFGLPVAFAQFVKRSQPGMPVRSVRLDVVAAADSLFSHASSRAGTQVRRAVLTPAVDQQTDTGDKPSFVMSPPAALEFVVPLEADATRLQAAVGADQTALQHLPEGCPLLPVEYRVLVGGDLRWSTVVEHRPMPAGVFNTEGMRWRHVEVEGARGVPVLAGQTVRLETTIHAASLPDGFDASSFDVEALAVGFGGVMLERTDMEPRRIPTRDAPNIVYIVIDTLRQDRVGCYGYDRDTTPRIDRLAAQGLRFEDAYTTSSWTWPSTASLLTSLPPDAHGVRSSSSCTLSQSLTTIAEVLQRRGYTTAAFVGNPIVEPNRYFDQGFEHFDVSVPNFRMSDEFVPDALEWLEENAPLRFFLYLHLVDPHTPHRPDPAEAARLGLPQPPPDWPERGLDGILRRDTPSEAVKQYASDLYDASVATGDRWVGAILDKLEELELDESTIVCLTSDHGEELFDRGFRGHGHGVHAELVRAPLILRGPGISIGTRRGVVSNRHVPTTLAAYANAALPGQGLMLHLVDDTPPDEALFETTKGARAGASYRQMYGIRRGSQTTIWWHSDRAPAEIPLSDMLHYDDLADPTEKNDLVRVAEDRAREGVQRMQKMIEAAAALRPGRVLGVGAGGQTTLEVIGYANGGDDSNESDGGR